MKVIKGLKNFSLSKEKTAVTVGVFDGVHRGHQKIIERLVKESKKENIRSVVLTFEPHPKDILSPGSHPPVLTSLYLKAELMKEIGVDAVFIIRPTKRFLELSPRKFIDEILIRTLNASCFVVGKDFRFGKRRRGDIRFLKKYGKERGIEVITVPLLKVAGELIKSTRVREFLEKGKIREAKEILGRYPRVSGKVVKGHRRGRILGFSTANLKTSDLASIPANGVYAGFAIFGSKRRPSVIDIGTSPTFKGKKREIHVHILNFHKNLYGKKLEVEVVSKIRGEVAFPSHQALIDEIEKDVETTKKILKAR